MFLNSKLKKTNSINILVLFVCILFGTSCQVARHSIEGKDKTIEKGSSLDEQFIYYFSVMDSIASRELIDTSFRSIELGRFMSKQTGIEGEAEGTYFGRLYFTKKDLRRWKRWYKRHLVD